jgi:hypothetical protein
MDQGSDMLLEPVSQNLGDEFNRRIEQGNWLEVSDQTCIIHFRDKSDIGRANTSKANIFFKKIIVELVEIMLDNWPKFFHKFIIESIWAWGLVIWEILNH